MSCKANVKEKCTRCSGTGRTTRTEYDPATRGWTQIVKEDCNYCSGKGYNYGDHDYKSQGVKGCMQRWRCSCGDSYEEQLDFER